MEALMVDVKNYDAFRELVEGGMMSEKEGMYILSIRCYYPLILLRVGLHS